MRVVGGLQVVIMDYSEQIANQGMDMQIRANEVKSPATGKPLQVRGRSQVVGVRRSSVIGRSGVIGGE